MTATLQHETQVEDAAAAIATREPLTSGIESQARVARAAGNRAFARMALDAGRRPPRAMLARCSCGAPAAGGGTCAACASEEEFVPELDALRGAVARRTLARCCVHRLRTAPLPKASLTEFVQQTEAKPENVSKAAKRQADCAAGKPACTTDGHAAVCRPR